MMIRLFKNTLLALSVASLGAVAVQADALSDIQARGSVRIAVSEDFPPYGSIGLDLKPAGYDVDVALHVAEKLGVKAVLSPVVGSARIPSLQTDKVDLVFAVLGKSPERAEVVDFGEPYGVLNNSVFAEEGAGIKGPDDLKGKTVGVLRGGIADVLLSGMVGPEVEVKRYEDEISTTQAFLSGQVDSLASADLTIYALRERKPARMPEEMFVLNTSKLFVAAKKGEAPLLERVNAILLEMRGDGTLEKISQKWLKRSLPSDL